MNLNKTFRNLSPTQSAVFEQIAIGRDEGHNQRTLDTLMKKKLITQSQESGVDHIGQFYIYRYEVPLDVHMEWCAWCTSQLSEVK